MQSKQIVYSAQQEAFLDELSKGRSHVSLAARAGTGKTFTAREGMRNTDGHRVYCAFNKHVATEFGRDLPPRCKAATMHSLGFAAVRESFGNVQVDEDKTSKIVRDYGSLVRFVRSFMCVLVVDLMRKVKEHKEREVARLLAAGKSGDLVTAVADRCDCVVAVSEGCVNVSEVVARLEAVFADEQGDGVVLSSVHRAKGLEADDVAIIRPELMPHPASWQPWEVQQELNIAYVAVTRSKRRLRFAGDVPAPFRA